MRDLGGQPPAQYRGDLAAVVSDTHVVSASTVVAFWRAWNAGGAALPVLPSAPDWQRHCADWRGALIAQADLGSQLLGFVSETR